MKKNILNSAQSMHYMSYMIYGSLFALAIGLVTSTTTLSLFHILIILPTLYFISHLRVKDISKSSWALIAMAVVIILSVAFNQDISTKGYKNVFKVKYFLFGFISILPLEWWFKNYSTEKKVKHLCYTFFIATTVATIAGIVGMNTGYNYISMRPVNMDRNAGLSGMVLNYAHNLACFQIFVAGLILYRKRINHIINEKFLYIVFIINTLGLYLSYTRGALLAFIIGLVFIFLKDHKKKFIITAVTLFLLSIAAYFFAGDKILRPGSDRERISQWKAAIKAFEERPVLGYGYLNFEQYSVEIKKRYNIGELQFGGHAHNNFLEMLASTGILGFLCYVAWLVLWLWELYKRNDIIALIGLPMIMTIIVSGLTQSTISLGVNLFFIMAVYSITQMRVNIKDAT